MIIRNLVVAAVIAVSLFGQSAARAQSPADQSAEPITVSTRIVPPFVLRDKDGKLQGFSIDLWNALAKQAGISSQFVVANDVSSLLSDVASGRSALGIAAISITADREKAFDFSQPMFDGGLQIAIPVTATVDSDPFSGVASFVTSWSFLELILGIIALVLLPTPFIWLAERDSGSELLEAKTPLGQFGQAIWWSMCALGGQAQDMPGGLPGRAIAGLWLMFAVLFSSFFTAAVTTRMTVKQLERGIEGPNDLPGRKIVTVKDSTAAAWLRARDIVPTEVADAEAAIDLVKRGTADAVVYDAPVLEYLASHAEQGRIRIVGPMFKPEHYGIVYSPGAAPRRRIDEALLFLRESGDYQQLKKKWFGGGDDQ